MNIPKQLKIGGHIYKVICPYIFRERTDRVGSCDYLNNEILIGVDDGNGKKRNQTTIEETLFHEILHAVDRVYNADSLKEEDVQRLSQGIYQVFKDNNLLK